MLPTFVASAEDFLSMPSLNLNMSNLQALTRNGIVLGTYPLRVLPSKTAIVPVNNQYLPRTEVERELCGRTVYAANIDKKVDRTDVQAFFETLCGEYLQLILFT